MKINKKLFGSLLGCIILLAMVIPISPIAQASSITIQIPDHHSSNHIVFENNRQMTSNVNMLPVTSGKIAFTSDRDGNREIYVMNADGSTQTRLTSNMAEDTNPEWSPDGTKIAFTSHRDGNYEVYMMNANGSDQARVTTNLSDEVGRPAWSPDGLKILFNFSQDGNHDIYVMNADGSGQTKLTNDAAVDWEPAWSPDGNLIAFVSNRDGNFEIYTMNPDGSTTNRLTFNGARDSIPSWSSEGTRISFDLQRDGNEEIYVMNADGSNQTNLTHNSSNDWGPSWSPVLGIETKTNIVIYVSTTWTSGIYTYGNVLVTNSATLTLDGAVTLNCTTLTIEVGANISADVKGYPGSTGPGKGGDYGGGGGAGYGGNGGNGSIAGGTTYGSVTEPIDLGSGGGKSSYDIGGPVPGGAGGGAIRLNVSDTLTVDGTISANGANGQTRPSLQTAPHPAYSSGGGSGGSIYITTSNLAGNGSITANGGDGGDAAMDAGGGGGGRIAIYYGANSFSGTVSASGGWGYQYGEDGTIFTIVNTVDTTPPETEITSGPIGTIGYNDVTFTWTGSDDSSPTTDLIYSYYLEAYDDEWSGWTSNTSSQYTDLPAGDYTFSVKARDQAGNVDLTPVENMFSVMVTTQVEVEFSAEPTSGVSPLTVQFIDESSVLFSNWEWDFNNDGIVDSSDQNPLHAYGSGTYTVTLSANGPNGAGSETKVGYIIVESTSLNEPPIARFTCLPAGPKAGEEVVLDASPSEDPDGTINYFEWDLNGDGNYDGFTRSPKIYYYWSESGSYHVELRVADSGGAKDSYSTDITVKERGLWEKVKGLFSPSVKELSKEEWARFQFIKTELGISNWPHSDSPKSDADFLWTDDNKLLTVLKKPIDAQASELTYESHILDTLHDMRLADSVSGRSFTVNPIISEYFDNMAEVNVWVKTGLMVSKEVMAQIIRNEMGGIGIGIGPVLMLWDLAQAGVGIEFLDQTFYKRSLWHYFELRDTWPSEELFYEICPVPLKYRNETTRQYFEELWSDYGGAHISSSGGLKEDFKEQVVQQLRKLLVSGLEQYKFEPYHIYRVESPGELRIYDSQGKVTGLVNSEVTEEIPNSTYDDETGTVLIYPAIDLYDCQVMGTDDGAYGLTIHVIEDGETITFSAVYIPMLANGSHRYTIDWDSLRLGEDGVTLQVDSDGDGDFERTVSADKELTVDEFWPYCFTDSARGTKLRVDDTNQTFQFITPDKEYSVKKATRMKVIDLSKEDCVQYDGPNKKWKINDKKFDFDNDLRPWFRQHQYDNQPEKIILVHHQDKELRLSAVIVDGKEESCVVTAKDLQTKKIYLLIDKPKLKKPKHQKWDRDRNRK